MNSKQKIDELLADADKFAQATGNDQLIGALAAARAFGIQPEDIARGLLPDSPDAIDNVLVILAVQALKRRSDDASVLTIAVDGGDVYSVRELFDDHAVEYAAGDEPVKVPIERTHHHRAAVTAPEVGDAAVGARAQREPDSGVDEPVES